MDSFIKVPNLPQSKVSLAVVDGRIPSDIENALYKREIRLIKTRKLNTLYNAVSFHPDILMCHIGDNKVVVAKNAPDKFIYDLESEGINIILGESELNKKYPLDVFYNVCIDDDSVICNERYVDPILLNEINKVKKRIINVKQGYTKCSTLIVSSGVFVTSDIGIHTILIREKRESLLISPMFIDLFDMNYGFIGGASGKISFNEVGFYGNIKLHEDYKMINSYFSKNSVKPISLSENKLIDLGTLIPLKEYNSI